MENEPILDGYDFQGWYSTQPDINLDMQDGTITIPAYDVVIKGAFTQHTADTYTVTYDLNGGTISDGSPLQYPDLEMGEKTPTIPNPTKAKDELLSTPLPHCSRSLFTKKTDNDTPNYQQNPIPQTDTLKYKLEEDRQHSYKTKEKKVL